MTTPASSEFYLINPATGECPSADSLTESECVALDGLSVEGMSVDYASAGTWDHDTCGCYIDQGGSVYFNKYGTGCTPDAGEISICKGSAGKQTRYHLIRIRVTGC